MATMERPKGQRHKRSKKVASNVRTINESSDEDEAIQATVQNPKPIARIPKPITPDPKSVSLDIDFPITKCDDIISHDCFVSSEFQVVDKNSLEIQELVCIEEETDTVQANNINKEEQNNSDSQENDDQVTDNGTENKPVEEITQNISLCEELKAVDSQSSNDQVTSKILQSDTLKPWTQSFEEPTAPEIDSQKIVTEFNFQPVKYPDLSTMSPVEVPSGVFYQTYKPNCFTMISQLKPFTAEQMREIYHCPDIEMVNQFELDFLMNSLMENHEHDPFYQLLMEFYTLQGKLSVNLADMANHTAKFDEIKKGIWVENNKQATFNGVCADGVTVKATTEYKIFVVNENNLALSVNELNYLHQLLCYNYTLNAVSAELTRSKINKTIDEILSYPVVRRITNSTPISLSSTLDSDALQCVSHLRRAITILFSFTRKPSPNSTFITAIKSWITRLVALHLRLATREDHWFLLFHILRCPNGVGTWTRSFIQLPLRNVGNNEFITLSSPLINHCISILYILLLPVKRRSEFLKAFSQSHKEISDPIKEDMWILIESDGEEGTNANGECTGLRESDLITLLNQMPFEALFCCALNIRKGVNDYVLDPELITGNQVLKVIGFCSTLVEIFGEGMLTYNRERYKQLAKRLGRLVRHILQYVSDYYELFIRNNLSKDPYLCERINVELNAILIKACSYIYRTRNLATWQYFSSLPYSSLDSSTVWQLFFYLNVGFPTQFPAPYEDYIARYHAPDFWNYFNGANADSSDEDLYYLLQAFFEMANERDKMRDWELVQAICLHIFDIGFINQQTRDICYKTSRDMLVNLTLAYQDLMSSILLQLKIRFEEIENAAYLLKSLPLENWKPTMDSFEILSNWLLHYDYNGEENIIARIVISHLNWGLDCDGRLYLPHNIHVRMACLVCESLTKHAPDGTGVSGITENTSDVRTPKEKFVAWCWNMILILRLHLMDQSVESITNTLQNPAERLIFTPDLERIDILYQGVSENRPLAIYAALLVTLWGHSVPLICQKGFDQMRILLNDSRYVEVIRSIELVVPFFIESPEVLATCESFQMVLTQLLNADRTYMKMAKDIFSSNSHGPVLELLDSMIQHQITNYYAYSLRTPLVLVNVWIQTLTHIPNWQNTVVVYLIDKILQIAFSYPDVWAASRAYFCSYYKDCCDWKCNKMSTLKMLLGTNQTRLPNLTTGNFGWFILLLLEVEFELQDATFWQEYIRQLSATDTSATKVNLDAVLKKTSTIVRFSSFPAQNLVIFKCANLISTLDPSHPALPLLLQKFFILFHARVQLDQDSERFQTVYGVSDKFYEFNVSLMKKIKSNLKAAEKLYAEKVVDDNSLKMFYETCSEMMKTYSLWLEETTINKVSKDNVSFPRQYNPTKLQDILCGNTQYWTEFVFLPLLHKQPKDQSDNWRKRCLRSVSVKHLREALQPKPRTTPLERIKTHIRSYDTVLPAPNLNKFGEAKYLGVESEKKAFSSVQNNMKVLYSAAKEFNLLTCELNSLNLGFKDIVQQLYDNVEAQKVETVPCSSLIRKFRCQGPAKIVVKYQIRRKRPAVERKLELNRERHATLTEKMTKMDFELLTNSMNSIDCTIRFLVTTQSSESNKKNHTHASAGIQIFYHIVENMTEVMMSFSPCKELTTSFLSELSIFIQDNLETEGQRILQLAFKRPDLLKIISNLFVPHRTKSKSFIEMYKFLIDSHKKLRDTKIIFVLLSKFDILNWFETFHPKLVIINELLKLIISALENLKQVDSEILQDLFRRHLLLIYEYEFPEHYGEVVQLILNSVSEQKILPIVLLDALNSFLRQVNCEQLAIDSDDQKVQSVAAEFARRQTLFDVKAALDTVTLFAKHFQTERLNSVRQGLYSRHKEYLKVLAMWFSCFNYTVATTAIAGCRGLLADQISDFIFTHLLELYTPWLVVYTQQPFAVGREWRLPAKENPWGPEDIDSSRVIISPFINSITFVLENLPVSQTILGYTFVFYANRYAQEDIEPHILQPIHDGLSKLPWELFGPLPTHITLLYESLEKHIPEAHAMLGHIFIRIDWSNWIKSIFVTWAPHIQTQIVSRLFVIFVKISFEPNIHKHTNTSKILEDAITYPWHLVEFNQLQGVFQWIISSVEPSILLQLPSETNYADRAVLDLLKCASAMGGTGSGTVPSDARAKRILYARSVVRLLRMCATKHRNLLISSNGSLAFSRALNELLDLINNTVSKVCKTREECDQEALNLMIEITSSMQSQSEEISKLFIDILVDWLNRCSPGCPILCQTLYSLGHSKAYIAGVYRLLESTVINYFRYSPEAEEYHSPSWKGLIKALLFSFDKLEIMPFIRDHYFLSLHAYIAYKMHKLSDPGEKITFLQNLSQLLENIKTNIRTEPRIAIIWGIIVSSGCKILKETENAKKPLLMLARHFHVLSTQTEGWSDGLLEVIGIKKDGVSNRRKILTRCISCIIFSLFPDTSSDATLPNQEFIRSFNEMKMLITNKKFSDVKTLILNAIELIDEHKFVNIEDVPGLVYRTIRLFYNDDFLDTVPEIWSFEFKWP